MANTMSKQEQIAAAWVEYRRTTQALPRNLDWRDYLDADDRAWRTYLKAEREILAQAKAA